MTVVKPKKINIGKVLLAWVIPLVILQTLSAQPQAPKSRPSVIVFVCQHGAAKSVIAAAYFNKLASERQLNFHAIARGVTPQPDVSPSTVEGLEKDGVPTSGQKPRALTREDLEHAVRVIAFCPLPAPLAKGHRVESLDVPSPMDAYETSRDAILARVRNLMDELASEEKKPATSARSKP